MKWFFSFIALFFFSFLFANESFIPILNLQDYTNTHKKENFLESFEYAVKEIGYFFITGMMFDSESIKETYAQAEIFFKNDEKKKYVSPNGARGYLPSESAKGETRVDFKECYHIGRELSKEDLARLQYEKNIWPKNHIAFRSNIQPLYEQLDFCKNILAEAFSELLDQEKAFIRNMVVEGDSLMRLVHYPANPPKHAIWAGAHTDICLFTMYPKASAEGLQVKTKKGKWIPINIPEGMLFVHCGDMLENLSNGLCEATVHRVIANGSNEDRYSIIFFIHPRSDDRLDPLASCIEKTGNVRLYANLSRIELLIERLIDLGLANKTLMEIFVRLGPIEKLKEVGRFSSKAEMALIKEGFLSSSETN